MQLFAPMRPLRSSVLTRFPLPWRIGAGAVLLTTIALLSFRPRAEAGERRTDLAPTPIDGVAAVVGKEVILRSEVRFRRAAAAEAHSEAEVLSEMIDELLIVKAAKADAIEVPPSEVATAIDRLAAERQLTREALDLALTEGGTSMAELEDATRRQLLEAHWVYRQIATEPLGFRPGTSEYDRALRNRREARLVELRRETFVEVR